LALAVGSLTFLTIYFYINNTHAVPAFGGIYTEGAVGQPRFINPIYGQTNDIDRTLVDLVFSGLMNYDKNGQIVPDLAESYTISSDGKTYTFTLKNNIFWHDGKTLNVDDVLFTVKTMQNSDYKSPQRANWIDVDVQKISDNSLAFILKQPYNSFLENCIFKIIPKHIWENISPENFILSTYNLQPIGSGPFEFKGLRQANTGFIESLSLASNRKYYATPSFVSEISFNFFEKMDQVLKAANTGAIDGFALAPASENNGTLEQQLRLGGRPANEKFSMYSFSLPRYFAVFFNNQKTSIFSDKNIRQALTYSVNKNEISQTISITDISSQTKNNIEIVDSPILPDFFNYQQPDNVYEFDVKKAENLLDKSGFLAKGESASGGKDNIPLVREKAISKKPAFQFKSYLKVGSKGSEVTQLQGCLARLDENFKMLLANETNGTYGKATEDAVTEFQKKYLASEKPTGETGTATRKKLNELCIQQTPNTQPLAFTLVTINQPQLVEVANLLKNYWKSIGVSVTVNAVNITDIKPIIKNRGYDALLYGETLGIQPDLYPFWYSSQKLDPGLNLSSYENKDVDKLLKDARQTLSEEQKKEDLEKIQTIILNDAPALFLYNPHYLYWASQNVSGIDTVKIADPAKRFSNITNWYLQTKRVWK